MKKYLNFSVLIYNTANLDSYNLHKQKLLKVFKMEIKHFHFGVISN